MLRAVTDTVAQVAKPARSQENAASTGRLSSLSLRSKGNLRYAGPHPISFIKNPPVKKRVQPKVMLPLSPSLFFPLYLSLSSGTSGEKDKE
jgi:hypothetical protein